MLDGADVSDQISSKAAAIIALVLMRETRQMRRSDIISYLWSESSDDAAKYNLRFNLWQIKKALVQADGESLPPPPEKRRRGAYAAKYTEYSA